MYNIYFSNNHFCYILAPVVRWYIYKKGNDHFLNLTNEPSHEIMELFVLRKLIVQTRMRSHPVGLDVRFLVRPFVYFHTCGTARMRRLVWAFAGRLCYKYHNLMSWLKSSFTTWEIWDCTQKSSCRMANNVDRDATPLSIWSGSIRFAQTYLSQYVALLQYDICLCYLI